MIETVTPQNTLSGQSPSIGLCSLRPETYVNSQYLSSEAKNLMEKFLMDNRNIDFLHKASLLRDKITDQDFTQSLIGALFERLAAKHIEDSKGENYVVLSPWEVFHFYTKLYPERKATKVDLNRTIRGISFPDLLIFRRARRSYLIDSVIECKSSSTVDETNHQLARFKNPLFLFDPVYGEDLIRNPQGSYRLGEILTTVRPELPVMPVALNRKRGYNVYLATPKDASLFAHKTKRMFIPISGYEFSTFVRSILTNFKEVSPYTTQPAVL